MKHYFATHKATLVQDTERFLVIDWRRADGGIEGYVNYIVDKERGSLIVSGDLSSSIASWGNPIEVANLQKYLNDLGYYISKMQCSTDTYSHYSDDVVADIKKHFTENDIHIEANNLYDNEDEFWTDVENEVDNCCLDNQFRPTELLISIISDYAPDYRNWLYYCGQRIKPRVHLWALGFQMACAQLNL